MDENTQQTQGTEATPEIQENQVTQPEQSVQPTQPAQPVQSVQPPKKGSSGKIVIIILAVVAFLVLAITAMVIGIVVWLNMNTPEYKVTKSVAYLAQDLQGQQNILVKEDDIRDVLLACAQKGSQTEVSFNVSTSEVENMTLGVDSILITDPTAKQMASTFMFSMMNIDLVSADVVVDYDDFYLSSKELFSGSLMMNVKDYEEEFTYGEEDYMGLLEEYWSGSAFVDNAFLENEDLESMLDIKNRFEISKTDNQKEWMTQEGEVTTDEFLLEFKEPFEVEELETQLDQIYIYLDSKNHMVALTCPVSQYGSVVSNVDVQFLGAKNSLDEVLITVTALNTYGGGIFTVSYKNEVADGQQDINVQMNLETDYDTFVLDAKLNLDSALSEYDLNVVLATEGEEDITLESDGRISVDGENNVWSMDIYNATLYAEGTSVSLQGSYSMSEKIDAIIVPDDALDIVNASQEELDALMNEFYSNIMGLLSNEEIGSLLY